MPSPRSVRAGRRILASLEFDQDGCDYDADDAEAAEFMVGKKARYDLRDMDWMSWERDVMADARLVEGLLALIADIDPRA